MFNPIKMNLYLNETCPLDINVPISTNVGGNPKEIITKINNNKFKYLLGLFIDKSNKRTQIYFKFNEFINKQTDIPGTTYLGKGGLTSVFGIQYLTSDNIILPELFNKNLIIRITDSFYSDNIEQWIQKYIENKKLFGENLIDIYLYGGIYSPNNGFIGFYIITRYYNDWKKILTLNYDNTVKYFYSLINFLVKIEDNKYFYRDLKITNIGLDIKDPDNYVFMVLDYDDITLINDSDDFFNELKKSGCFGKYCAGTMIPYFIIKDYLTINSNWLTKFNKVHVVGLAEIMIHLFFVNDINAQKILNMLYDPGKYSSCIHYYQFMNLYDNNEKYDLMEYSLISLKPKFYEINLIKKDSLIYLMLNLLSKDYQKINSIIIIKDEFKTQIIDLPTHIQTSSGQLMSLDNIQFIPLASYLSSSSNKSSNHLKDNMVGGIKKNNIIPIQKYYI